MSDADPACRAPGADAQGERLLVVGQNSFIARHLLAHLPAARVRAVGHAALDHPDLLDGIACVINCARHPDAARDGYHLERDDPDVRLAARLGACDLPYVMLSTRQVYAQSTDPLREDSPLGPWNAYGRHKLMAEQRVRALLGERLTVLRLGNIFGDERTPGRRTFLAILLERLARLGEVRFDMSPFTERDFLPVERCARVLARLVERPPGGVLNVGSGIALPTGRLALWIIEGFGRGRLVVDSPEERDAFVLDVSRLRALCGVPCTLEDLRLRCLALGRALAGPAAPG